MDTLKAEKRSMDVKAKRLRREGYVIGNLFGKEITGSIPLKLQTPDVERLLQTANKGSQVMLEVDGRSYDALIKEIDYNALAKRVDEIDFQALVSNEKVHSVAEIVLVNHEKVVTGILQEKLKEISYKALPSALVDRVKVDVGDMRVGDTIWVRDLDLAKNPEIHLITDPDAVIVTVTGSRNADAEEDTADTGKTAAKPAAAKPAEK